MLNTTVARSGWMVLGGLAVAAAIGGAGCSLDRPDQAKFTVNIDTSKAQEPEFKAQTTPASLGDINCFAINVRSTTAVGASVCNGLLVGGIPVGAVQGRPATFDLQVVPAKGVLIEAFGFQSSACHNFGDVIDSKVPADAIFNGKVYRLGQVVTDVGNEGGSATITAAFDGNQAFDCAPRLTFGRTVVSGQNFSCGSSTTGSAYCWGTGGSGELGNGAVSNSLVPVQVNGVGGSGTLTNIRDITVGNSHSCAVNSAGNVFCWGSNSNGQLGNNSSASSNNPVQVSGVGGAGVLASAVQVGAGSLTSCATLNTGTVACWGNGGSGQLGDSTSISKTTPVSVSGTGGSGTLGGIAAVSAATSHACAKSTSGTVYCWGDNTNGQLGNNSSATSYFPVQVLGIGGTGTLSSVSALSTGPGSYHSCAVNSAGTVTCWGMGTSGQLGDNSSVNRSTPVQVVGVGGTGTLSSIVAVTVGANHSCAVENGGNVYCWGSNSAGQLGNSSSGQSNAPVLVHAVGGGGNLSGIASVGAGTQTTCATNTSGNVFCWGSNSGGALGNNSSSASNAPVQVHGVGGGGFLGL